MSLNRAVVRLFYRLWQNDFKVVKSIYAMIFDHAQNTSKI
jgi:hypothetical protein